MNADAEAAGRTPLAADGERFLPSFRGAIRYEHLHRYALCLPYAAGRRVLDVASGEGYGSALLADVAAAVIGVDIAEDAIAHARATYGRPNLRFERGDAAALPLETGAVDLAVSFETIEHVGDHRAMVAELRRVLAPGGVLIISSPNKAIYSDAVDFANPFHVHELYIAQFEALLRETFAHVALFGQRLLAGSVISRVDAFASGTLSTVHGSLGHIERVLPSLLPMYAIAVCSDREMPVDGVESLYLDDEQDLLTEVQLRVDVAYELLARARHRADVRALARDPSGADPAAFALTGTCSGAVDAVEDGRTGLRQRSNTIAVGPGSTLLLSGWALLDGAAADDIVVTIDGRAVALGVPLARPDVGAAYGSDAGLAGFSAECTIEIAAGEHTLEVSALDNVNARRGSVAVRTLRRVDPSRLLLSNAVHLDPALRANAVLEPGANVMAADVLHFRGWAFHHADHTPVRAAALLLDGETVIPVFCGEHRPDVAELFAVSSPDLGVEVDILAGTLGIGRHTIALLALGSADEDLAHISHAAVTFIVR